MITTRQWPQYRVPRCFNYVFNSVIASRELYCNSQSLRCRHTALSNLSTWGLVPSRYCASLGRRDRTSRRKLLLSPKSWRTSINIAGKRVPSNESTCQSWHWYVRNKKSYHRSLFFTKVFMAWTHTFAKWSKNIKLWKGQCFQKNKRVSREM